MATSFEDSWIIAGPARTGKSTLVQAVNQWSDSHLGFPFEGLLPRYFHRHLVCSTRLKKRVVKEYLEQSRYIDVTRTAAVRPIDLLDVDTQVLVDELQGQHHITMIGEALNQLANRQHKRGWVVADLHAELYFERLRVYLPGIRMLVLLRDPRESVCASIFGPCYPDPVAERRKVLRLRLWLWWLSATSASRLSQIYPEEVKVLCVGGLRDPLSPENEAMTEHFGLPTKTWGDYGTRRTHFTRNQQGEYWTPDNEWRQLLTGYELMLLERANMPRALAKIGSRWPYHAKGLLDLCLHPSQSLRRELGYWRTGLKNLFCTTSNEAAP